MSSTFVADTSDSHKSDNTVIIIVNSDGSLSLDQETLQSLLANQQNTNVSVVRVGGGGLDGGDGKEGSKDEGEGDDDGSPQLDLTVEGIFPAAATHSDPESSRATSSLTAVSALAAAASVAQDAVNVEGAANPGVSVGGVASTTPGATSASSAGEGLDPFLEMDPEQLQRLETALQSEQAKQILGEGVTAMLDMLSSDEQTNITDTIRMDHCYTSLGPGSAPPNASSQGAYSSGASNEGGHGGRRMHRVNASDDEDDDEEDDDESSDSGESYGEPSRSRGRGRGRGRARGRLGGRWAGSGVRGRGGRGGRAVNVRGGRGSGAHVTQTTPIIPKPSPPVVQKVITSSAASLSPSLAAVTAASLVPPSNVGTGACLVPVLKQLDLNPTLTRTETVGSSKEPVKVVMMPVLDRKHGAQHSTVPQGIMIIPGKSINPSDVKPVIAAQRVITSSVPVNIAPKAPPTIVAVPKTPKLTMGSSPTVTTVVMSTHSVQPKVEVVQQPKVCLTNLADISGLRVGGQGDVSKVKVEKLSSPEILSMQSGLQGSRDEDDGDTTATTTDNTEDTEEDDLPESGAGDEERDESARSGRGLHGGRRSWGGARVRGRGLRGFRPERESGMGVLVRGGRGGSRGRRRGGRPRSGGEGGRGRGGRGGKRIPETEEDHTQVAADAVAMGIPSAVPKKPIIVVSRGGKKVIVPEKVHVEKLPQQDIGVPVSALEEPPLPSSVPEPMSVAHVEEKPENTLNNLASASLMDTSPGTSVASKATGLGSPSEALLNASRKLYPKRENRKPPAHLADAFGPALFSAPDVMRRVPEHAGVDASGMPIENNDGDEEMRLVLSEDEEEKAVREMHMVKAKSTAAEVDLTPKPKEVLKEVEESKAVKVERVEVSSVKAVEEVSSGARGGRRRRTAAAAKRLAKKEEMEEAMASEEDEEDEEEEDDDTSVNSEDDPNRLWCICKKPHNNRFMICCDICEDWFHGKCVGVTKAMGRQMEEKGQEWNCPNCTVKQQKEKEKERKTSSLVDEDWDPGKKKAGGGGASASSSPAAAAVSAAAAGGANARRRKSTGAAAAVIKPASPPPQPVIVEKKKQQPLPNQQHSIQQLKASEVPAQIIASAGKEADGSEKKKIMYCIVCKKEARPTSIYCSDTCILKHAQESLSLTSKEKQSGVSAPAVVQSKAAPAPVVVKDVSKEIQEAPVIQHVIKPNQDPTSVIVASGESSKATAIAIAPKVAKGDARVIVYERKTGRLMTGANAPTVSNLRSWLKDHPTFEVVRPGVLPTKFYGNKVVVSKKPNESSSDGKHPTSVAGAKAVPVAITPKPAASTPGPKGIKAIGQHATKAPASNQGKAAGASTPATPKHPSKSSSAAKSPIKCLPLFTPTGTIAKTTPVATKTQTKCPVSQVKTSAANTLKVSTHSPKLGASGSAPSQEATVSKKLIELKHVTQASGTVNISIGTKRPSISSADGKSDGETSSKKSRMPSGTGASAPPSTSTAGSTPGANSANNCEPIRLNVQKTLQELLQKRIQECDDLNTSEEDVKKMALNIEEELYGYFKDTGMKYKSKYRSLVFNIKDPKNLALFRKIVEGQVDPHRLVRMSPEELASQELAQWRERETKHQLEMIKKNELDMMSQAITYVMKTHKGEQVIEKDESLKLQESVESKLEPADPSLDLPPSNSVTSTVEDITLESSLFSKHKDDYFRDRDKLFDKDRLTSKHKRDDKDGSGRGGGDKKGDRKGDRSKGGDGKGSGSHKEERRKDRGKSSRHHDRRKESGGRSSGSSSTSSHRSSSGSNGSSKERKKKEGEKEDCLKSKLGEEKSGELVDIKEEVESDSKDMEGLDDMKKEEFGKYEGSSGIWGSKLGKGLADDSDTSDREPSSTVTIKTPDIDTDEAEKGSSDAIWKGYVSMSEVAKFFIIAHPVSGYYQELSNDLPDCLDIVGRISPDTVWEYISKMKKSGTKEIVVIRLTPANDEEKISYLYLYNYLAIRNRFGVVGNASKSVKDFYLMPLASHSIVPQVLLPLDGPGFEDFRPHLLIGIIVRLRKKKGEKYGNTRKLSTTSSESMSVAGAFDSSTVKKDLNFERSYTPPLPLEEDKNGGKCSGSFTPPHPPPAMEGSYTPPQISSSPPAQGIIPAAQVAKRKPALSCSSDIFTDGGSKSPINPAPSSLSPLAASLRPLVASLGPLPKNLGNIGAPSSASTKMDDEDTPYSPGGSDPDTDTGPLLPGLGGDIPVPDQAGSRLSALEDDDDELLSSPKDPVELARKMEELNRKIEEQKQQIQTISSAMVGGALPKSTAVVSSVSSETVVSVTEPLGVSTMLRSFSHILGGTDSMGTGARCSPGSTNGGDARDDDDEAYSPSRSFTPPPQVPAEPISTVPPPISLPPDTSNISLPSNLQEILASIKRRDEGAGSSTGSGASGTKVLSLKSDPIVMNYGGAEEEEEAAEDVGKQKKIEVEKKEIPKEEEFSLPTIPLLLAPKDPRPRRDPRSRPHDPPKTTTAPVAAIGSRLSALTDAELIAKAAEMVEAREPKPITDPPTPCNPVTLPNVAPIGVPPPMQCPIPVGPPPTSLPMKSGPHTPSPVGHMLQMVAVSNTASLSVSGGSKIMLDSLVSAQPPPPGLEMESPVSYSSPGYTKKPPLPLHPTQLSSSAGGICTPPPSISHLPIVTDTSVPPPSSFTPPRNYSHPPPPVNLQSSHSYSTGTSVLSSSFSSYVGPPDEDLVPPGTEEESVERCPLTSQEDAGSREEKGIPGESSCMPDDMEGEDGMDGKRYQYHRGGHRDRWTWRHRGRGGFRGHKYHGGRDYGWSGGDGRKMHHGWHEWDERDRSSRDRRGGSLDEKRPSRSRHDSGSDRRSRRDSEERGREGRRRDSSDSKGSSRSSRRDSTERRSRRSSRADSRDSDERSRKSHGHSSKSRRRSRSRRRSKDRHRSSSRERKKARRSKVEEAESGSGDED
ncbi:death-inducer obliterator 1 [Ischnura elegans]|uniref:death-inducer obliterator 1 n=1 Tax=Ischnura elegans TaxID=197161 RepID=UPI001ED8AFC4|nr:death-inducer obliterator 1 [Ischnura elegans]